MSSAYSKVTIYGDEIPPDVAIVDCNYGATLTITRQGGGYTEVGRSAMDDLTCSYHYYDTRAEWAKALRDYVLGTKKLVNEAGQAIDREAFNARLDDFIFGDNKDFCMVDTTSVPLRRGDISFGNAGTNPRSPSSATRKHHTPV